MSYFVYILYSPSLKKFYKGQTNNVQVRLKQHNRGEDKSTRPGTPWQLFWVTDKPSRAEAMKLEKKLKNLSAKRLIDFMRRHREDMALPHLLQNMDGSSSSQ
jgi:putative endonuclease